MAQRYEIRMRGRLPESLVERFAPLEAAVQPDFILLTGVLPDRAALHGVLAQIKALGLELLEVRSIP